MADTYPHSLSQALIDVTRALNGKPEAAAWDKITELLLGGADICKDEYANLSFRELDRLAERVAWFDVSGSDAKLAANVIRAFAVVRTHSRVNCKQKLKYLSERAQWRARAKEAEAQVAQLDPTGAKRKPGSATLRVPTEATHDQARTEGRTQAD